ncbi:MAG: DNA replication/repair protein RecF [Defluviitaleaceae bacterium]|nr:DNA replication/repair protein RecF [Defluviitaleaceae bacterium]MCL2273290.1 DNA replication/repair protein RecF [Defluviitaleaceae bacterium]
MWVRRLTAEAFRNLRIPEAKLSAGINILHGDNAQGKTNFLEAVYFNALGRTLRADHCRELIPIGQEEAHTSAEFCRDGAQAGFTVDARVRQQKGKHIKSLSIDRIPITNTRTLFGSVPIVSFSPDDLRLIKAGPTERRRFMDIEICQLSPVYYQDLRAYHRALRQRNFLLKAAQKDKSQRESLPVWDMQLIQYGTRVMRTRTSFVEKISAIAGTIHQEITQGKETLYLRYKPAILCGGEYASVLEKNQARDIILGTTQHGPHRDDITFTIRELSARSYGSQGQQRTAALSVKLAEITLMRERMGTLPILLLDDVFSELDAERQKFLLAQVRDVQTLLTCTGLEDAASKMPSESNVLEIKDGKLRISF